MRNEDERNRFNAEQEILAILSQMNLEESEKAETLFSEEQEYENSVIFPSATNNNASEVSLIFTTDFEEEMVKPVRSAPRKRVKEKAKKAKKAVKKQEPIAEEKQTEQPTPVAETLISHTEETEAKAQPVKRISKETHCLFPMKGDPASEVVRKIIFLLSLIVFLVSLGFLSFYMVLEPHMVNKKNDAYVALFTDTDGNNKTQIDTFTKDIQPSFRQLYNINKDINGWLSFNSTDSEKFMDINLPVVWCGDNNTYLTRGFDGKNNRAGTLFFEQSNTFTKGASNKVTIIYGHNMASGAMLSPLNKLIGNVYHARSAATLTLDTLYDSNQYKVIAVVVNDESADTAHRFGYLRTAFTDSEDFMNYVNQLRARSLFDYPVDVQPNDELIILSTCTNKSQVKLTNGRLAIVARRVRDGETPTTDTAKIVKNDDVIMPYAWYTMQSLTPHAFYTQADYVLPIEGVATTTTGDNTTATTTDETTAETTDATTNATRNTAVAKTTVVINTTTKQQPTVTVKTTPAPTQDAQPTDTQSTTTE